MGSETLNTHQKALRVNLDSNKYGTFAEIGAGQEVARWFFRVGGASGTIAKTMSAYDMAVSDAIYGAAERYVSRTRLVAMLDHEYHLLEARLKDKRGESSQFFVFADTVAASSYSRRGHGHGWLGVRFLNEPGGEPSQVIIHVRLLDSDNLRQQEALGILGVNLVYGIFYLHHDPTLFLGSLLDGLSEERLEVDMVTFSGPAFRDVDNRLMSLRLVHLGLTGAAMFTATGEAVQPADAFYKKNILVERGSFRPVTKATLDMLECAQTAFLKEPDVRDDETVVIAEMTLRDLIHKGEIDHQDFLDRADTLGALGKTVLISRYARYFRLATYLFNFTKKRISMAMGVPSLQEVFDEKYYDDLGGGILESLGRLFKNDLKLYVYPLHDSETGELITAGTLLVDSHLRHLYAYLIENHSIEELRGFKKEYLPIFPAAVLEKIQTGDPSWKEMVPPQVATMIEGRRMFSYSDPS
jgi:hypothetical protein